MYALYRPLDLKPLDEWVQQTRRRRGLVLLDKFGAAEELPRVLGMGSVSANHTGATVRAGTLGFIADQNAGDRGLFVPFFGRLASTYKTIGLLALLHSAPIVCGQARRLVWSRDSKPGASAHCGSGSNEALDDTLGFREWNGEPYRYRIDVVDVIQPEEWATQPDPLFYVTARYRRALEEMVRRSPEQNLWMHRYWKSRPRHERLNRPFPAALRRKLEQLPWMTQPELDRILEWSRRDTQALHEQSSEAISVIEEPDDSESASLSEAPSRVSV
jgi:KDO2-lipid IV(A) lauroyltransferase